MKSQSLFLLAVLVMLAAPATALAEVPGYFPVQAFLTDADGVPLDGSVEIDFTIYDAATGGEVIFSESHTVQADAGAFTAYLGAKSDLDLDIFVDHDQLFLGVAIDGGAELEPRQRLATVPFAARAHSAASADSAATLDGREPTDFEPVEYTAASPLEIDDTNEIALQSTCDANSILKWDGSHWQCEVDAQLVADSPVEITNGRVGLIACANGQVLKSNGTAMVCAADATVEYVAGDSLVLSGNEFSVADGGITSAKLGNGSVTTNKMSANAVTSAKIANGAVTGDKLANGSVNSSKIAAGSVTSTKIADGSVTSSKLSNGAVTSNKIAAGSVTSTKIADGSVNSAKLTDGSITDADVSSSAGIAVSKIDMEGGSASYVAATVCPAGNVDGPACDDIPPGSFCEYDSFNSSASLNGTLDNCGAFDWYFRTR